VTGKSIIVYGQSISGNCYKIKLLCSELGIDYEWREVDILAGATRTPEYLAMNPNGKVPLLCLGDGRYLAESNAILCYLANDTELAGSDRYDRARVLQWLFFEQYSHEPYIATSRFIIRYLGNPPERRAALERKQAPGHKALEVMDGQLKSSSFMNGEKFTIADIALFAYTHIANEGGFDLGRYDGIAAWLSRIRSRANYIPMYS
jgi:glutathione S-transferase